MAWLNHFLQSSPQNTIHTSADNQLDCRKWHRVKSRPHRGHSDALGPLVWSTTNSDCQVLMGLKNHAEGENTPGSHSNTLKTLHSLICSLGPASKTYFWWSSILNFGLSLLLYNTSFQIEITICNSVWDFTANIHRRFCAICYSLATLALQQTFRLIDIFKSCKCKLWESKLAFTGTKYCKCLWL